MRAHASTQRRSLAWPAPSPLVFVGVLTEINTMSASAIASSTAVEKLRLRPLARLTTASRPGSYTGSRLRSGSFQASIRAWLRSTTVTCNCGQRSAITAIVGPPTYPAPIQQMRRTVTPQPDSTYSDLTERINRRVQTLLQWHSRLPLQLLASQFD